MARRGEEQERPAGGDARDRSARLRAENQQLRAENQRLRQQLEELERRLGLHSGHSGQPPSSDGPAKPPAGRRTRSQRGRSGQRPGGQPGHRGATLRQTAHPDHVETHRPPHCGRCGAPLAAAASEGQPVRRQVCDLPPPQPLQGTEPQALAGRCGSCGSLTRAAFPAGVPAPVQDGPRLAAAAVYLQHAHFLPEERLPEIFRDLWGGAVCAVTLAGMTRRAAERWRACAEPVRDRLATAAGVQHLDETGFRIGGQTQGLPGLSTPALTSSRSSARRGSLPEGLRGCLVHDPWQPYCTLPGVQHALCHAHHLRELPALQDIDQEAWASRMQRLLRWARQAARSAGEQGLPRSLAERLGRCSARLVRRALAYPEALPPLRPSRPGRRGCRKRRPGPNLALRLRDRQAAVLRCVSDPRVPCTNNPAERDLRRMKLRRKISGGFRSAQGARACATLRSVLSTARKQGLNRIETLRLARKTHQQGCQGCFLWYNEHWAS